MSCGKVEEPSSSRRLYQNTARFAAISAILTVTLSRSDRAPISSTVSARPGWHSDLNGCGFSLEAFRAPKSSRCFGIHRYVRPTDSSSRFCQFCFEQSLALTSKGAPNGRHKWTERDHARDLARDLACRVEHAWCERFYGSGKDDGRRAAKAIRRTVRL